MTEQQLREFIKQEISAIREDEMDDRMIARQAARRLQLRQMNISLDNLINMAEDAHFNVGDEDIKKIENKVIQILNALTTGDRENSTFTSK